MHSMVASADRVCQHFTDGGWHGCRAEWRQPVRICSVQDGFTQEHEGSRVELPGPTGAWICRYHRELTVLFYSLLCSFL